MGPTEIVVDITTNACPALLHTDIYVNGQHVTQAPTPACDPNDPLASVEVGKITLLPTRGIDSHVDITVVGNVGGSCDSADTQDPKCIVARRALSFNPHKRLDLPIFLDSACAGLQCSLDQTCVVDATGAHCGDSTCGKADAPVCEGDGGVILDAGGFDVITIDAGPPACPTIVPPNQGFPTFSWSFPTITTDGVHEDANIFKVAFTGASVVATPPIFCNTPYLHSTSSQALATSSGNTLFSKFGTKSFIVGLAFNASSGDAFLLQLVGSSTQGGGFDVLLVNGAVYVSFNGTIVYKDTATLKAGMWHRFAMEIATIASGTGNGDQTTLTPYVDGVPGSPALTPVAYNPGTPVSFSVGPADVDDVTFYAK